MHHIQVKLLKLAEKSNQDKLSLRAMAEAIGETGESPQNIKHHLTQLEKKGFIRIDRETGAIRKAETVAHVSSGANGNLFAIPIFGTANCGPALTFADQNIDGFLHVSRGLIGRSRPDGLFAVKADGQSMNKASVDGRSIEDGDLVIIDSQHKDVVSGDVVLAVIDGKATIKRYIDDKDNNQIVLAAQSSCDFDPIYLQRGDNFIINGRAVSIVKRPKGL